VLEARHLTKRYHSIFAVENVSFDIRPGEVQAVGPNGSGKSTTVNMVVGLLEPSSGTLSLFGESLLRTACA
jgi:ABC-2 type transport system ATP-binding protein